MKEKIKNTVKKAFTMFFCKGNMLFIFFGYSLFELIMTERSVWMLAGLLAIIMYYVDQASNNKKSEINIYWQYARIIRSLIKRKGN